MSNNTPAPAFNLIGVDIQQDAEGRYSLGDLHRAAVNSGVTKDIRPNEWMALQQTDSLAKILIAENPTRQPIKASAGRYGGTYVCKELVYAYAMWVSAAFHVKVIRTFDAVIQQRYAPQTSTVSFAPPPPAPLPMKPTEVVAKLRGMTNMQQTAYAIQMLVNEQDAIREELRANHVETHDRIDEVAIPRTHANIHQYVHQFSDPMSYYQVVKLSKQAKKMTRKMGLEMFHRPVTRNGRYVVEPCYPVSVLELIVPHSAVWS
jgi:hypothetical protein